ncbi:MAG: GTPase HflX, partial [Eubacteriales bacterium]|nr:GTPase HflX [Eubacteriales bacterium]
MSEKLYDTKELEEKLVLIGIDNDKDIMNVDSSLDELEELVNTAGATVIGRMIQKREGIHKAHYFGKGKIDELKAYVDELGATGIVCDDELTSSQMRNMEKMLNVKIMNRTLVILDIFASRASSAEGKVQVELAQLKYKLTHLTGQGKGLSRLGGGIGTRGPGEKKLETDRRNIADRISELNRELKQIEKHRQVIREKRLKNKMPIVAFVGYTNAGKSTLLNKLTNANVLAMDKLFATLDTTTRKIELESGREYLFTDTVGFIQKLPHNLVKAFKATLEETKYADVLIHVVDCSNSAREQQMEVVYKTLKDLDCLNKPIITVFNKSDKENIEKPLPKDAFSMYTLEISAKTGIGLENMLKTLEDVVKSFKKSISILIPYEKSNVIGIIHGRCEVISNENRDDGMFFEIYADDEMENKLR